MNRWKASATHLVLSIVVIGGIALAAFLLWYPYALHRVAGLDRILLVMLGIDLTAGPLLTLILYRQGKWGLKFDLTVIAIAQLAFLSYGLHTLWEGRPVFLVGMEDQFTLVFASEIDAADLEQAPRPEWRRLSWTGPQLVGTRIPTDPDQRRAVMDSFMSGGAGIERSPRYYEGFDQVAPALLASASPPQPGNMTRDAPWIPIVSRRGEGRMVINPASGHPIRAIAP